MRDSQRLSARRVACQAGDKEEIRLGDRGVGEGVAGRGKGEGEEVRGHGEGEGEPCHGRGTGDLE